MNINLTPIIQAFIALLAALVTYRLIPWIKARTTSVQQDNMRAILKVLVFAAEQLYGAGKGRLKLEYVQDWLENHGYDVSVDEIEAAVYEHLNRGVALMEEVKSETTVEDDDYELPPLEEWPLKMIVEFCRLNDIPCEGCQTKDEYILAITQGGQHEPPDQAEAIKYHTEGPNIDIGQVIDDAEEPVSTPEAEG